MKLSVSGFFLVFVFCLTKSGATQDSIEPMAPLARVSYGGFSPFDVQELVSEFSNRFGVRANPLDRQLDWVPKSDSYHDGTLRYWRRERGTIVVPSPTGRLQTIDYFQLLPEETAADYLPSSGEFDNGMRIVTAHELAAGVTKVTETHLARIPRSKDGELHMLDTPLISSAKYFRHERDAIWESNRNSYSQIELPGLAVPRDSKPQIRAEFDVSRIPLGLRNSWTKSVRAAIATRLQVKDGGSPLDRGLRILSSTWGLAIVSGASTGKFTAVGDGSAANIDLEIDCLPKSQLAVAILNSTVRSRIYNLVRKPSTGGVYVGLELPDWCTEFERVKVNIAPSTMGSAVLGFAVRDRKLDLGIQFHRDPSSHVCVVTMETGNPHNDATVLSELLANSKAGFPLPQRRDCFAAKGAVWITLGATRDAAVVQESVEAFGLLRRSKAPLLWCDVVTRDLLDCHDLLLLDHTPQHVLVGQIEKIQSSLQAAPNAISDRFNLTVVPTGTKLRGKSKIGKGFAGVSLSVIATLLQERARRQKKDRLGPVLK
jgi:hypothetical protein